MSDDETPDQQPEQPEQQPEQPDVGSVGEEAAKLLGALSEWARESGGDTGAGLGATVAGLAGQAAGVAHQVSEHVATGAPECTYCPVCRTVHVVRTASPEVKAQLATAASSFLQAMAGLLQNLPPTGGTTPAPGSGLERIDLDGDDDE